MKKLRLKSRFYFRPIHFLLLLAIDLCVLAGVLIPQQSRLADAKEKLADKQTELEVVTRERDRQIDNLNFMQTTQYKLQQGSIKYGWHFSEDTFIEDESITPTPRPSVTVTPRPSVTP